MGQCSQKEHHVLPILLKVIVSLLLVNLVGTSNRHSRRSEVIQNLTYEAVYDNRISPHFDLEIPTEVRVHIFIYSIDSISESTMDYTMTFILTQIWNDPRLNYTKYLKDKFLELNTKFIDKVWVPDLYFANEKQASFHHVTMPNKMMHLYRNGTIKYRVRNIDESRLFESGVLNMASPDTGVSPYFILTMTAACPMNLQNFPLDTQICSIVIKSFVYTPDNVIFKWRENNPVSRFQNMEMAQFEISSIQPWNCSIKYEENSFTCIVANIHLQRRVEFFLLQVFIPSTMIVFISWVSFWLPINAVPARIALGSTTVLIMITQRQSTAISLPPVSYIKAIDVWTVTCLVFVFAALLEYAVVSTYSRHETKRLSIKLIQNNKTIKQTINVNRDVCEENGNVGTETPDTTYAQMRSKAKRMDVISRVTFPVIFFLFSLGYWSWYLRKAFNPEENEM